MAFSVFETQDINKENVPPRNQTRSRRSPFDLLVCRESCLKSNEKQKFCLPSILPFVVYEDKQTVEKVIGNNVGNQKSLFLKTKYSINEAKVSLPKTELDNRKPLMDIGQFLQTSIRYPIETDEKVNIKHVDESSVSCCVYTAHKVVDHEHDAIHSLGVSLAAHQMSCNINTYTCELYSYFKDVEKLECPDPECIRGYPDVTHRMRSMLVEWLVEVTQVYMLHNETLYLAISFIDRYLSLKLVDIANLRLLGTAAIFIASKHEEIYHLDGSELVRIADDTYTETQILNMAESIVEVLWFNVSNPTTIIFLKLICVHCKVPLEVMYLAMYLAELTLLEADPYLSFMPSMIGCGAIALARLISGNEIIWPEEMSDMTNYFLNDLVSVLKHLNQTYKGAGNAKQTAIRLKYKSVKYHCVSEIEYKDLVIPDIKETSQKEVIEELKEIHISEKSL